MADDREKISNGPNDRPLNETIAGTGPGKMLTPFRSMVSKPGRLKSLEWAEGSENLSQWKSAGSEGNERRTA